MLLLCRLFRVYRYHGSLLCLSNDPQIFLFPFWATEPHDNDLIFTCVWWNLAWPIEVFYPCSMIRLLRMSRPGGDCIIECPTCYEMQRTDRGSLLSFSAPASLSSHLPFSFLFPRLFMGFFSLGHDSQGYSVVQSFFTRGVHVCKHSHLCVCEVVEPEWGFFSGWAWGNLISSPAWSHLTYCCYYCWCSDPQWS